MPHSQFTEWALKNLNTKVGEHTGHRTLYKNHPGHFWVYTRRTAARDRGIWFSKKGVHLFCEPALRNQFFEKYGFFPDSGIFPFFSVLAIKAR